MCHLVSIATAYHVVHSRQQIAWVEVVDDEFACLLVPHVGALLHRIVLVAGGQGAGMCRHQVVQIGIGTQHEAVGILPADEPEAAVGVGIQVLRGALQHFLVLEIEVTSHFGLALDRQHVVECHHRVTGSSRVIGIDGVVLDIRFGHGELQGVVCGHLVALRVFPADEVAVVMVLCRNAHKLSGGILRVVVLVEPSDSVGDGLERHGVILRRIVIRPPWVWRIHGVVPACLCRHPEWQ